MIKIGEFSKICNVSTQTLRYYDAEGILKPDVTDATTGYRFYSLDAIEKYKQILFYKNLGFSLDEIKNIQVASDEQRLKILQKKKEVLLTSIDEYKEQIRKIDDICKSDLPKDALSEMLYLPFTNDHQVIGKWKLCGKLLDANKLTVIDEPCFETADQEIIFMPGGAFAWKYFWTKGTLYRISPKYKFAIPNSYKIVTRDDSRYMIVQFMSDDCIDNGEDITLLLYRQMDHIAYTEHQIRSHIDRTDFPFEDDDVVLGEWQVFDFVHQISEFSPCSKQSPKENVYMVDICFLPRGICTRTSRSMSGYTHEMLRYTKGFVLNDKEMTAEEYQIKIKNGKEFLFVQHKSGDYFYGGLTPHWYVFERKHK